MFCKSIVYAELGKTLGEGFRLDKAVRECKDPVEQERLKQVAKENLRRCWQLLRKV